MQKLSLFILLSSILFADNNSNEIYFYILFSFLLIIGVFGIYFLKKILVKQEKIVEEQIKLDEKQSNFLINISQNIQDLISKNIDKKNKNDVQILDITNNLIEFLQLKSNKIEINNSKFKLDNVLNEVSGYIASSFPNHNTELIFNIDNDIPTYITGDAALLEKILTNFIEFLFSNLDINQKKEVILNIYIGLDKEDKTEISFSISDNGEGFSSLVLKDSFVPSFDDKLKTYSGLGLFVSKSLIELMNGSLTFDSNIGKGTQFNICLPFKKSNENTKLILPQDILNKKIFIVDINYKSSLAIKKMFLYFGYEVSIMNKDDFLNSQVNLSSYDILVLSESLFTLRNIDYLYSLKNKSNLKIISIHSLFRDDSFRSLSSIIDDSISAPLTQSRIYDLLIDIYREPIDKKLPIIKSKIDVIDHNFKMNKSITQNDFKKFAGMNLLIVEDNLINQKVISNILKNSGINITIANNGVEAIDIAENNSFDFILMDINMPIMDGYQATRELRSNIHFDNVPIVAFTALALQKERDKIFNMGMNGYLTKPIDLGRLFDAFNIFYKDTTPIEKNEQKIIYPTDTLDYKVGLSYAGNNKAFYSQILREFLVVYGNSNSIFEKLVREKNYTELKKLALDLKGLSSYIGANKVFNISSEILSSLLDDEYKSLINYNITFNKEINNLKISIEEYLQQ